MKVLFLVQKEQRAILDRLYDGIAAHCECDTRWLSSEEQADLRGYFRKHVESRATTASCSSSASRRKCARSASFAACPTW